MARKIRLFLENIAIHIVVKGINKIDIFVDDDDYFYYKTLLEELSKSSQVFVHAYSLSSSQISMLCTFDDKDTLSRFMQSVGLKYVSYFNKKYKRRGTLWEGRYKSSLVEDKFVLHVMQYIESLENGIISSFTKNALDENDTIVKPHEMYTLLGKDHRDRAIIYKKRFFCEPLNNNMITFIEEHLNKQTLTGSLEFYKKIETLVGQTLRAQKRGRPKQNNNKGKRMFTKLVVLDKEKHKSLKISPLEELKFAKDLSFIPVLANETSIVSEMFPVVFTADEEPSLVTLTSLGGSNLAINEEGKYISRYVPAFLRKHPFSLANTKEDKDKKVILIDEEAKNISKIKGKQLFTKDGEQSEVLKNAISFLTDYETQHQNTLAIVKTVKDSGILEDREISVGEGEDKKVLVNGFQVVNRDKLNELGDDILALWVRKGIISFIDSHINSLSKIDVLFKLASQKQQN